ncbi:hypothetical protein V8G54_025203 [Vigna mungo]|uniref:Uncharacterized protein n=1 Tax=Vigna mungo TaxID=3915 RepID=A0AAQ3RS12_VIGMU
MSTDHHIRLREDNSDPVRGNGPGQRCQPKAFRSQGRHAGHLSDLDHCHQWAEEEVEGVDDEVSGVKAEDVDGYYIKTKKVKKVKKGKKGKKKVTFIIKKRFNRFGGPYIWEFVSIGSSNFGSDQLGP